MSHFEVKDADGDVATVLDTKELLRRIRARVPWMKRMSDEELLEAFKNAYATWSFK